MPPTSSPHGSSQQRPERAPLMRRQSSQSSQTSKPGVHSPGSGDYHQHPLRHAVKPARRTKIVLPRNHSSARDLSKLARPNQNHNHHAEDVRKAGRQRSHEGDTEIRLPGSLDESNQPPTMKRNMTAYQLPRNTSYTKLKKNLSHGQLQRLGSGKNLANLNSIASRGPPSPGLKNRKNRPKSADMTRMVNEVQQQEAELAHQQQKEKEKEKEPPKKVGFAVGSSGDSDEDAPDMEGSGMQEDEWTDQSASASPYSTRQNTANNSRRASMTLDKLPDKRVAPESSKGKAGEPLHHAQHNLASEVKPETESSGTQGDEDDESSDESKPPSPRSQPEVKEREDQVKTEKASQDPPPTKTQVKSPLHMAREPSNPATRYLMNRTQGAAQAQVGVTKPSEEINSAQASPAPSMRSSRSNMGESAGDQDQEELVSRFIPSTSHPSTGSVSHTTTNTPKTSTFHTPENESTLAAQNRSKPSSSTLHPTPTSPGSTFSGSSGATTPAMARSRTELRMMNEKAIADLEDAAARNPLIPPHVYDRRNESLKTYLHSTHYPRDTTLNPHFNLGPELFQGRFKAVHAELRVVQRFRDPLAESLRRLERCKGVSFSRLRSQRRPGRGGVAVSRSGASLSRAGSRLSTSTSPPKSAGGGRSTPALSRGGSQKGSRVTFSQGAEEEEGGVGGVDAVARALWEEI